MDEPLLGHSVVYTQLLLIYCFTYNHSLWILFHFLLFNIFIPYHNHLFLYPQYVSDVVELVYLLNLT